MSATANLYRARLARKAFEAAITKARRDLVAELTMECGVPESDIDELSFINSVSDGISDMLSEAMARLERDAEGEDFSASVREKLADVADYHSRVA